MRGDIDSLAIGTGTHCLLVVENLLVPFQLILRVQPFLLLEEEVFQFCGKCYGRSVNVWIPLQDGRIHLLGLFCPKARLVVLFLLRGGVTREVVVLLHIVDQLP